MPKNRARKSSPPAPGRPAAASVATPAAPLTAVHLAFAALIAAACVIVSVSYLLYDTDAWEHLLVGKAIWTLHRVPTTQLWEWPDFGARNTNPSWGFEVLLWPFWRLAGVTGLFAWRWIVALATFALLWAAARRLGARGLAPLFVLVMCALVYRQRAQIRPEMLAGLLFALAIWILADRDASARRLGLLILVAWAWANVHLSYYLLFLLLGFRLLDAHLGRESAAARRALWLVTLACAAISFVNPFGWRALAKPVEYALWWSHEPFFQGISEIQPIVWSQNWSNGLPLMLAGWPALLAWRARRGRVDRVEWLAALTFTGLAFSGGRFAATWALAAAPYIGRGLSEWFAARRAIRPAAAWPRTLLVSAAMVAACAYDWTHNVAPLGLAFDMNRAPVAACDWMEAHGVRGRGMNHFQLGGYLLWRFWPERDRLPFMDIHAEESPRELRDLYVDAMTSADGWRALDQHFRFDWALFSRRYSDRTRELDVVDADSSWALVFVDDVAALYVSRGGGLAPLAERFGYRTLGGSRASIAARLRQAAGDSLWRARMRGELERQARESPVNFYGRSMLRAVTAMAP